MGSTAHLKEFFQIPLDMVEFYEDEIRGLLSIGLKNARGELTANDVIALAKKEKLYLFVGLEDHKVMFVAALELNQTPRKKWVHVTTYAGKARDFYSYIPWVSNWAKMNGCSEIRGFGTEAAMRLACRHGFKEIYRVYSVEV